MLARHDSELIGPSAGAFFLQAVFADLVCGTRHVQPLLRNGWTCRVVRTVVPHTKVCEYSLYKTLLMMDR